MPIYVNGSARGTLPRDHSHGFMPSRKAAFDNADVILLAGTRSISAWVTAAASTPKRRS